VEQSPAEHTALTAEQALREKLLDLFLWTTYEQSWCDRGDLDVAVDRFDNSGVDDAIETICADPALHDLALREDTKITTEGMGTEQPLFRFDNGGDGDPLACDHKHDEFSFDPDFPVDVVMVVYGSTVASTAAGPRGGVAKSAQHRRAEAAYFGAEAAKRRAGEYPERAFADALDEIAQACVQDAEGLEDTARSLQRYRIENQMEQAVQRRRGHCGRWGSGISGRRLDRRLAGGRPRPRAVVRSSSRGGDSGSDSDASEPVGDGDPAGALSQALAALFRWWRP
jgi:hypothetical protein